MINIVVNTQKNKAAAKKLFPKEHWVSASSIKFIQTGPDYAIPQNLENIKIAKSRIIPARGKRHISDNDARTLAKEIRQAKVLTNEGASVFILPKARDAQGRDIPGPDALVNGVLYEFKTVTGSIKRFETRYRESREQGNNVYIRILNPDITRNNVIQKMYSIINDTNYTGGYTGNMIFSFTNESIETLHYIKIKDLIK